MDAGDFGIITYSLIGEHSNDFNIDPDTGEIRVTSTGALDREAHQEIILQVMASDGAPIETRRTASTPVSVHY